MQHEIIMLVFGWNVMGISISMQTKKNRRPRKAVGAKGVGSGN